jgi:hypothetical protein
LQEIRKVVCSHQTLQRRFQAYTNDAVLPRAGDDSAAMGRWPLIAVENIPKLNERALEVVGMTQGSDDFVSSMQSLVAKGQRGKGSTTTADIQPNLFSSHS